MPRRPQKGDHGISQQGEISLLQARIETESPPRGTIPHGKNAVVAFGSLPLSKATLRGLEFSAYSTMTSIQLGSIPHALAGRDILGAGKTGSGKTLSFLVPVLECLYRQVWSSDDGVGALILSPTRELAGQTFAVLRKIGKFHGFSAGLVIGGRNKNRRAEQNNDFQREQQSITTTNILVCTPGRLLQHLEQTPYFNVDALQMLVLDEADRILDMGFREQLLRILDYLPKQRQTLLFSATQTRDVRHLATLSINRKNVEYIGVHDDEDAATPEQLKQSYIIVPTEHKLNCVYSFLKSHLKAKTIAFMASCSQVRHAWDLFCRLRPGLSVLAIHGKLSQTKRMQVYDKFANTPHSVLFATDVASRGLDFPDVDWVLQIDAPEDPDMYIHRVGRTARFRKQGQALMLLDPNEEPVFQKWEIKTPIQKKSINPTKTVLVTQRAASLVAEHTTLNQLAKKAFTSYVRSLALLPRHAWAEFELRKMNLEGYATSLGLASMPSLEFLGKVTNRAEKRETKNVNRKLQKLKEQIRLEKEKKRQKRKAVEVLSDASESNKPEEDDLLVIKARHEYKQQPGEVVDDTIENDDRHPKKIRIESRKSVKFDDSGGVEAKSLQASQHEDTPDGEKPVGAESLEAASFRYMDTVRHRLAQTQQLDKEEERQRIRSKHKKRRLQEKSERGDDINGTLPSAILDTSATSRLDRSSNHDSDYESVSSGSGSGESEEDNDEPDVAGQENVALALIRGQGL